MIKFDEKNMLTGKDELIHEFVNRTGLSEEQITNLYESYSFIDTSLEFIRKSFESLLTGIGFNFDNFKKVVTEMFGRIAKETTEAGKRALSEELIVLLQKTLDSITDTPLLFDIVMYILYLQNPTKFKPVLDSIGVGIPEESMKSLNESQKEFIDIDLLDNKKHFVEMNESLKYYLGRNNKRWGNNGNLDNVYTALWQYIQNDIENIVAEDNVHTVTDVFHMDIINQLLKHEQMDPIFRSVANLKQAIPDLQTFMFDLMLITEGYIRQHGGAMEYLKQKTVTDYRRRRDALYSVISSSSRSSKVLDKHATSTNERKFRELVNGEKSEYIQNPNGDNYSLDWSVIDIYQDRLPYNSVINMVHMIKAMTGEFNLTIRPVINNYVTSTLELLTKFKRVVVPQNHV